MDMNGMRIGFALTGSFCNLHVAFKMIEEMKKNGADITAIISYNVDTLDTRHYKAIQVRDTLERITGKPIVREITEAEPIGQKSEFDILMVCPTTSNTLAKLANGITDTPVLMSIRSQLGSKKPVVIGVATNDGLGNNARNLGYLMAMENVFFIPFYQDDPIKREMSLLFSRDMAIETIDAALNKRQLQPVILGPGA